MSEILVEVRGVSKVFTRHVDLAQKLAFALRGSPRGVVVHALDGIDLTVGAGEVVGLVGESGSGKSTLGRIVADFIDPSRGEILLGTSDRASLPAAARRRQRLAIQMVFQDAISSLNPRLRVCDIVGEAPLYHGMVGAQDVHRYVAEMLEDVGMEADYANRYPHQFSGGQRARIGIARALAVKPRLIVADEPVAALDASVQAQVLNLFMRLRREFNLAFLFISHDLSVVRHLADRVAILYLGRVVELANADALFAAPNHPYTQGLLANTPRIEAGKQAFVPIPGEIPSPIDPPRGCHFHPRCLRAMPRCREEVPTLRTIAPGRLAACHLNDML